MNSTICTEQQFAGNALTGNTISECRFNLLDSINHNEFYKC